MIMGDLLGDDNVRYHIDSATLLAMVESNANLLKRLNQAPSGFMISGQRFGQSTTSSSQNSNKSGGKKQKFGGSGGTFSKSKFNESYKKFGDKETMKSKIEIFTSYIEESNIERIKSMNLLPIFVIKIDGKIRIH